MVWSSFRSDYKQVNSSNLVYSSYVFSLDPCKYLLEVTRPFSSSPVTQHLRKTILLLICSSFSQCYCRNHSSGKARAGEIVTVTSERRAKHLNVLLCLSIIAVLYISSRDIPGEGTSQNQRQNQALKTARKVRPSSFSRLIWAVSRTPVTYELS